MFDVKPGQYYYAPHRGMWGVWLKTEDGSGDFVKDFVTRDSAREFVYDKNNWKNDKGNIQ